MNDSKRRRAGPLMATALVILLLLFVTSAMAGSGSSAPAPAPKPVTEFVGTDTCISCHEEQSKRFQNTVMGKVFAHPRTADEKLGCEACHGPGKAHLEAGGGKDTIAIRFAKDSKNSVEEQNYACIQCHKRGNRMFWAGSPHESRGMRCVDCHDGHSKTARSLARSTFLPEKLTDVSGVKKSSTELCLDCHQMRKAQLQRSSHMPFREGKVSCTSCHNPHGTPNPAQLIQSTINENCYSCHAERRGPFLWSHQPVTENCDTCHEPHGSFNPQLLKARIPRLCQECHNEFAHGTGTIGYPLGNVASSPGGPAMGYPNKTFNRGCANCHSKIHGTNAPSGTFFLR
ncbi:MAG: DmsE family decaheme c-type cytochrome [Terriglobales bacterium]